MVDFDLSAYKAAGNWAEIPTEFLSDSLEETVTIERFPGCILPAWVNNAVRWYAVAKDQKEWRTLQPILNAYVAHTVTTFNGEPADLKEEIAVERYLATLNAHAVARLLPGSNIELAMRALERMKETYLARPTDLRPPPMSTARMLSHFDMCLVEGDRKGAQHWYSRLKDELRLDALNMSFTRVKLHANFRDWDAILSDVSFADLCRVRKPGVIAHHLLEALWFHYLEKHPVNSSARHSAYQNDCKSFVDDIFEISGCPSSWARDVFKQFGKERGDTTQREISALAFPLKDAKDDLTTAIESTDLSGETLDTIELHLNWVGGAVFSDELEVSNNGDWLLWAKSLDLREFKYREVAEQLAINGNIDEVLDPEDVKELEAALFDLASERELSRLGQALPQLLRWLKRDDKYPRKLMAPLYGIVLLRLIETRNREGEFREGITEMFTALLEVGLSEDQYKSLLSDIGGSIPDGAGTTDAFWLLDIADVLCRFSASQETARNILLNRILASLKAIIHKLSPLQQSAYSNVATAAGWDPFPGQVSAEAATIADVLKGKLVGIYTLTESAGRQAETAIMRIAPDAKVEVSSDKVCTPRLKKLSQNADFMIVTTSSAKHAATDCIRASRDADQIIYAAGRGCCSILRSLDECLTYVS